MRRQIKAFRRGYKCAVMVYKTDEPYISVLLNKTVLPSHKAFINGDEIFFHDVSERNRFVEKMHEAYIEELEYDNKYKYYLAMGRALGFPPKAIDWFALYSDGGDKAPPDMRDQVRVDFFGIEFLTCTSILFDDIKWLVEAWRWKIPEDVRNNEFAYIQQLGNLDTGYPKIQYTLDELIKAVENNYRNLLHSPSDE